MNSFIEQSLQSSSTLDAVSYEKFLRGKVDETSDSYTCPSSANQSTLKEVRCLRDSVTDQLTDEVMYFTKH